MRALPNILMLLWGSSPCIANLWDTRRNPQRYRFVRGLQHEATQRRLLAEHTFTYKKALEIVKGMEAADSNGMVLKAWELLANKFRNQVLQAMERKTCYCRGRTGHFLKKNANLRMLIVMLAARKDTSPQFASRYPRRRPPRCRDVQDVVDRCIGRWI